ncbi:hypothetical protein G3I19_02065 [Streptomyces sp. SID10853]|uniref:hypothetical protein n=1 Tax=Streptomyces sp. SID10853 TaxID=2706028 RepID=UPI0013C23E6F|nr:hypothetical protein [Streptomyces sp. SID10853]NDZ77326.1 hypothetical protein [Streptomyces sp. SID10853]
MNARSPHPAPLSHERLNHPRSLAAFRTTKLLATGYLAISVATLAVIALLRNNTSAVNDAVWTRGGFVVLSASVTCLCAARAARGSRGAYRRLRILSGVMVPVIALIIALPGTFPLWMKTDQGLCGLVLLGIVATVNGKHLRELFAGR